MLLVGIVAAGVAIVAATFLVTMFIVLATIIVTGCALVPILFLVKLAKYNSTQSTE